MTIHRRAASRPGAGHRRLLICDATDAVADLWTIEALAALALEAGRRGARLELRGASADLERLIGLCGLARAFGIAAGGTAVSPRTSAAARRGGTASGR
ncbi:MAG: hypothetical protein ACRDNJ_16190 [Solirubrobacteraceae bacterium]